jgi:polyphosphate kinase
MARKNSPFTNRELSWLQFNSRVLDQAQDKSLPLLERLKFLAITSSNLDEFFMVRVGGLQLLSNEGIRKPDPSGLTPEQQLKEIDEQVHSMVHRQYEIYLDSIEPTLKEEQIRRISSSELSQTQLQFIESLFEKDIFPLLSPIAVTLPLPTPLLQNRGLHCVVRLKPDTKNPRQPRYAIIPIGKHLSRMVSLPCTSGWEYILIEDIITMFASHFFPGEATEECIPFRVTRNADMSVREDQAFDLLAEMEAIIDERKRSDVVRLEIGKTASPQVLNFVKNLFKIDDTDVVYLIPGPLDLSAFMKITDVPEYLHLKNELWQPQLSPLIKPGIPLFDIIKKRSVLLYHPYESFEPVVRFIEEAALDPDVITIKQILYRTSRNSPIVSALIKAAERGKYVTAMVELKARFDEERNIEWARELEDAGVQVLYGVKNLKTHAKVCLVVRKEPQGMVRYMHFGTGNYNEITAHLYSDISYLTCDEDLGSDVSAFFNAVTGYSQPVKFRKIEMAPIGLRDKILELIESEIERKRQGQKAFIRAKMNSLADPQVIDALYEASKAGVNVELNIRGICCLRPGIKGISDNINVISIVDRNLEHSRIIHVSQGGHDKVYMSTADWMPRNLDKRIELLVPIDDPAALQRCINVLDTCFTDNCNSWKLQSDGTWIRQKPGKKKEVRSQEVLYKLAQTQNKNALKARRTQFEPHRPSSLKV